MASPSAVATIQDPRQRNRLRFLVRESLGAREALEVFRTSFGLRDQAELSDRATTQLLSQRQLSEEQLYDRLLWDQLVRLALSRISPERREQVKVALDIDSDEALGLRVVQDLMRDRHLSPEEVHDHLLALTLPARAMQAVRAVLTSTGLTPDEVQDAVRAAGYADEQAVVDAVVGSLQKIRAAEPEGVQAALEMAEAPATAELAILLVGLQIRSRCQDAGARRAAETVQRLRACLGSGASEP